MLSIASDVLVGMLHRAVCHGRTCSSSTLTAAAASQTEMTVFCSADLTFHKSPSAAGIYMSSTSNIS